MSHKAPNRRAATWLAGLALVLLWAGPARALDAASPWFETDQGRVRLVAASPRLGDDAGATLGLEFRLAPHWKIYWRSPGDAGYPPRLDWTGSTNLAGADLAWPAPRRFSVSGLETVGYTDEVVLPITARLTRAGTPAHFQLALSYLTCDDICIPYDTQLALDLAPGAPADGDRGYAALIARYAARVPGDGGGDLSLRAATLIPGKPAHLELRVHSAAALGAPDAFIEAPPGVAFGAPRLKAGEGPGDARLLLPISGGPGAADAVIGHPITVTLVDGDRALQAVATPVAGPPAAGELALLLRILPLALLGGFILNFMPCVLPVLSIKLLSLLEQGGRSQAALRRGFLATAAGILLSFLALAGVMLALRAGGVAVGWGVQFQQPLFLTGMVALLTLFACNLWGFFEVPLPGFLGGLGRVGDGHPLIGNLAAGAFATLLATPCSAPFLGTAIGFALAGGPFEIVAIFLTLGLGLALPYLAVSLMPRLARALPRPGRWMLTLRRILGLALAATALWLVSVLVTQVGLLAALAVGALMVLLTAVLALLHMPAVRRSAVLALIAAAILAPLALSAPPPAGEAAVGIWRNFDRAAIAALVRDGHVVFVDVTADWCLTCKVNERLVLAAPSVAARLASAKTVAMRADWTRPSDAIAAYLRSFGRYGIPFYAVYGPAAPQGLPLSEIITPEQVTAALGEAAGPGRVAGATR
jgi:suppressor for copper-sensitivity B